MKSPSLTAPDRERAWQLLLAAWHEAASARHATLSERGRALAASRFAAGDRDPRLIELLGADYMARKQWDREARDVLALLGESDSPEAEKARRAVVRCDSILREFSPSRLDWYREAVDGGSVSAAALLSVAALRGRLQPDAQVARAVRQCLNEASDAQWQGMGLEKAQGRRFLALWYSRPDAIEVPADAASLVREQLRSDPANPQLLRFLAASFRPRTDAAALGVYEALFRADPDDAANVSFLAEALVAGSISLANPVPLLRRWITASPEHAERAKVALAVNAAANGRDDEEALGWLLAAVDLAEATPQVRGWLAVLLSRRGLADAEALEVYEQVLFEESLPPGWRGEVGLMVLAHDRAVGNVRLNVAEQVWHSLPADRRPDQLALDLAQVAMAAGRRDGAAASIYRRAHELNPNPELAKMLAQAYLVDETTPLRAKIAHWRACLELKLAEPEVVAALAKAYASLGSATEAAIYVAESAPEGQRGKLLDDLSRYRFRRGDFAAAEALAAALVRLQPDNPDAARKLLACKIRRRLADGRGLGRIDTSGLGEMAAHPAVAGLLTLMRAAVNGQGSDDEVATAIRDQAGDRAPLLTAAAALAGDPVDPEAVVTARSGDVWLLALSASVSGRRDTAESLLLRLPEALSQAGRALFGLEPGDSPDAAIERMLPVIHRSGPPWDSLRAVALDLMVRHGGPELVDQVASMLDDLPALAAELRLVAQAERTDEAAAAERIARVETATHPDAVHEMRDSLLARRVMRRLDEGELAEAESLLRDLETITADRPQRADATNWLRALLARQSQRFDAAWDRVARLSPEARARPAVAWTIAGWHLHDGEPARAEGELGHALHSHPHDLELLYAVVSLNARLGRVERFAGGVDRLVAELPLDDRRREDLELLRRLVSADLANVVLDDLFTDSGKLPTRDLRLRLTACMAVAAGLLRARRPADAAKLLQTRLRGLSGLKLASELAPTLADLRNLRAYAHLLAGDAAAARAQLDRLAGGGLGVGHNLARVAAETGNKADAARLWEELLPTFEQLATERCRPDLAEALQVAYRANLAELHLQTDSWAPALAHLEACLKLRPYDVDLQRKCLPALVALGQGDVALHKSSWLLTQRPNDLEVILEHSAVLASVRGIRAGNEYLDEVVSKRPDAADVVRQKRQELRERLLAGLQQRAASKDFSGLFAMARDVEQLAETDEERAKAILQQAFALSNMAGGAERGAVLEQAYTRCEEALALKASERTRTQLASLRDSVGVMLAPELLKQADELLKHRRRAYMTLTDNLGAPPPETRQQLTGLAEAFERVAAMFQRAVRLGGASLQTRVNEGVAEAESLARECRRLEASWA